MPRPNDGYTGRLFEEEVLGCCQAQHRGYMRWQEAAALVRKSQPARQTSCVASLEREVSRKVGGPVKFFTAVRSTLDVMHGVDGWFEFVGVVVTVDLTMNPHKDSGKADLIVHPDDVDDAAHLSRLAGYIAEEFRSKERAGGRRW